jgi:hypothetical protein
MLHLARRLQAELPARGRAEVTHFVRKLLVHFGSPANQLKAVKGVGMKQTMMIMIVLAFLLPRADAQIWQLYTGSSGPVTAYSYWTDGDAADWLVLGRSATAPTGRLAGGHTWG